MPYQIKDGKKRCGGPLHKGEWIPLDRFYYFKKGPRKGKPVSMCMDCERLRRFGTIEGGFVPIARIWFVFEELQRRLGKAETIRRIGASNNLWYKLARQKLVRKSTAKQAMVVLREVRAKEEVRHKDSIRHGAAMRGRTEKVPVNQRDLYRPHGDLDSEERRARRSRE